jgi:hypothetical protein
MSALSTSIDYTSKDFDGFKSSLLDYATRIFPDWRSRDEGDFGVLLVELFAYMGDILSVYGDRIGQEAYLPTASQRLSMLQIANLLGYTPSNGVPASGSVTFVTSNPGNPVTLPVGTQVATDYISNIDGQVVYETTAPITVPGNGGTITATVTEGTSFSMVRIGTSTGLPDQEFRLPNIPVIDGSTQVFVENATATEQWSQIAFLVDADPADRVFSISLDSAGATIVRLGDGISGAIPTNGLGVYASYRVGGGVQGNRLAGSVTQIVQPIPGVSISVNANGIPLTGDMTGGADPETVEQIRRNAPLAFRTQQRLVTLQDFTDAALSVPGVSRASAVANHFTSVVVYVAGPGGTVPNQALKDSVTLALSSRALMGVSVTVAGPNVIPVNLGATGLEIAVNVKPRRSRATVKNDVTTALQKLLSVENVDFGMRISLSDVYSTIAAVDGVEYTLVPMFARADAAQTGTSDIQFRNWEIPTVGNIVLTVTGGIG